MSAAARAEAEESARSVPSDAAAVAHEAPPPRTVQNAFATLVARGFGLLVRLVVLAEVARYLPPEQLGIYGVLVSMLDVARVVTNFGLDTAVIRRMAIHSEETEGLLRLVLRLKSVFAAIGFTGLLLIGLLHPPAASVMWLPAVLGLALFPITWSSSITARFQAAHAMHWLIPVQVGAGAVYLVTLEVAARAGARLHGFLALILLAEGIAFLGTAVTARLRWPKSATPVPPLVAPIAFVREALPLGLYDMVVVIYARLGIFLLESQGPAMRAGVGYLYAAMRVNEVTVAIAGALALSALPVFSRLAAQGRSSEIARTFLRYSLAGAAFATFMALFFTLFGNGLITAFRPAYAPAAKPLVVFVWAGVAMFQNNLSISVLNAFGRFRTAAGCALLNLFIYAGVSLVLIPRLGALGAAISTLITEGVNMVVQLSLVIPLLLRVPPRVTLAAEEIPDVPSMLDP